MSADRRPDDELHADGKPLSSAADGTVVEPPAPAEMRLLDDVLDDAFKRIRARADGSEKPISTPWPEFNEQLAGGGFWPGCHVLVSGTGAGKSAWALQLALHTARQGGSVVYAGLELDDQQVAARFAAEVNHDPEIRGGVIGWSELYTGSGRAKRLPMLDAVETKARAELKGLKIYLERGDPMGWAASRMHDCARTIRETKGSKAPLLIVLDFLQLIGSEANAGRQDLRERIGRAAYIARDVARRYDAVVLLISSVSRENYARLSGKGLKEGGLKDLGLTVSFDDDRTVAERHIAGAEQLVGLGKESGEIEYAADSVTVALSLPREGNERKVLFATAKQRAGQPGWCTLVFDGFRFSADPGRGKAVLEMLAPKSAEPDATPVPTPNGKGKGKPQIGQGYGLSESDFQVKGSK
jgi:replicative DNA helicase